ncbi:myb family transcription factor PHL11-like [Hordeum vulgare subsp. vulgare]|nr:myb family transcription factor PHL11-like [Hordeum vulgare subsp. vulgare]
MPLEDTLRYEIQVQRELCEQLEVQKKLQMRIEAQGRYLKEILEKAQENISFDANGSAGLENARSQLTNFNLDLPGLSDNGTHVYEESSEQLVKAISDDNLHDNNLDFQLYRVRSQEAKNDKCTPKTEDLLLLDLNIKEGYDLSS